MRLRQLEQGWVELVIDMRTLFFICMLLTNGLPLLAADRNLRNGSDSQKHFEALMFTTRAYETEALRLVIKEANLVAKELELSEHLPISEQNLTAKYIPPPRLAKSIGGIGNITTSNYAYYVAVGNRFSFLECNQLQQERAKIQKQYACPVNQLETNGAYRLAVDILSKVSVDVAALNQSCSVQIEPFFPDGKNRTTFVPDYLISWQKSGQSGSEALVELCLPNKKILQLRITKPEYNLRPPIVFTNLAELLATNAPALTNAPILPR